MVRLTRAERMKRHRERVNKLSVIRKWLMVNNNPDVFFRDDLMRDLEYDIDSEEDVSDVRYVFQTWFNGFKNYCKLAGKRKGNVATHTYFEGLKDAYEKSYDCIVYKYDPSLDAYVRPNYFKFKEMIQRRGIAVIKSAITVAEYFSTFEVPMLTGIEPERLKGRLHDAKRMLTNGTEIKEGNCVFCGMGEMIKKDTLREAVCTSCGEVAILPVVENGNNLCPICYDKEIISILSKEGNVWICLRKTCPVNFGMPIIKNLSDKILIKTHDAKGTIINFSNVECPYCGVIGDFVDIGYGNYKCRQCRCKIGKQFLRALEIVKKENEEGIRKYSLREEEILKGMKNND